MNAEDTKRVSSTQLPSAGEVLDILAKESPRRAVRIDFVSKNSSIFEVHRELSRLAGSDDSWIDEYADRSLDTLVADINKNHGKLADFIREDKGHTDLHAAFYAALIPDDDESKSEAILVFGAPSNARIERAVELYDQELAPKIIISGFGPHYQEAEESEATRMANFAVERGVPRSALVLEQASITLPDNVKRTIDLLESMEWRPSTLTIVATNFVLQRAIMECYRLFPWEVKVKPVAAKPLSSKFTKEGWTEAYDSMALVFNEYAKMILESKIDLMQ